MEDAYFTDEKTGAQRSEVTCFESPSESVAGLRLEPELRTLNPHAINLTLPTSVPRLISGELQVIV